MVIYYFASCFFSISWYVQKQALEETSGINNRVFVYIFSKTASEKIFSWFLKVNKGKIICVVRRKLCLISV